MPLWDHCPFSMARPCSRQRVLQQRAVWPMYTLLHFLHTYLYIPFLFSGSIFVLFLLQSMLASFVPDLKQVLTPALVRARLIRYERPPGIKGMQAKGLYSSSVPWSSLNGRTSNRFSGMESVSVRLSLLVCLLRSFFFRLGCGGRFVFRGNGGKFGPVVTIIFIKVEKEIYFFFRLFRCGAQLMGSA